MNVIVLMLTRYFLTVCYRFNAKQEGLNEEVRVNDTLLWHAWQLRHEYAPYYTPDIRYGVFTPNLKIVALSDLDLCN